MAGCRGTDDRGTSPQVGGTSEKWVLDGGTAAHICGPFPSVTSCSWTAELWIYSWVYRKALSFKGKIKLLLTWFFFTMQKGRTRQDLVNPEIRERKGLKRLPSFSPIGLGLSSLAERLVNTIVAFLSCGQTSSDHGYSLSIKSEGGWV